MFEKIRRLWWYIFKPPFNSEQEEILWELEKGLRKFFVLMKNNVSYKIYWSTLSKEQKQFIKTTFQKSIDNKQMKNIMDNFNEQLQSKPTKKAKE